MRFRMEPLAEGETAKNVYDDSMEVIVSVFDVQRLAQYEALEHAVRTLRAAQRTYMEHRGDDAYGRLVALATEGVDYVLDGGDR